MSDIDPNKWINLEKVSLLLFDQSVHSGKIISQMLRGCGIRTIRTCDTGEEARKRAEDSVFDLMIVDAGGNGAGLEFIRWLRRRDANPNRFAPIILASGHTTSTAVKLSRDSGANFFIAKPVTTKTLLQRILWVSRDKRPFVEVGEYLGPDRRFKTDAPPPGMARRESDKLDVETEDEKRSA